VIQTPLNHTAAPANHAPEQSFFLSQLLGAKVFVGGKKVGNLKDLVIKENGTLPVVTHMYVSRPFGESALVPWEKIAKVSRNEIVVAAESIAPFNGEPEDGAVLLKDHILDKKAIDLDGREVEVVYDVRLVLRHNKLYVTDVDLSRYGLLRRIGLAGLANFIYELAESIREQTISWKYIQPLPEQIGRFQGDIKLNVLKEKLADMHPVDLADILEEMDPDQRVEIFEKLDPDHASDTLEEIDPNTQRDLVESLKIEKVAQLIDEMTTGQAADVLSVLSASEADAILELLNPDNARKIRAIMQHHEENILDFATQEYIAFAPEWTVEQAQEEYRKAAKNKDVVMYVYVVDKSGQLLGVLDIKELLQADDKALLKEVMVDNVITLDHDSTLREAAEMFSRYNFRALPITDDDHKILGVVTYRDIVGLKHRFVE
jgi:magnesium transporter